MLLGINIEQIASPEPDIVFPVVTVSSKIKTFFPYTILFKMLFDGVIIIVSYLGNNLIAATKFLNNTINSFFAFSKAHLFLCFNAFNKGFASIILSSVFCL